MITVITNSRLYRPFFFNFSPNKILCNTSLHGSDDQILYWRVVPRSGLTNWTGVPGLNSGVRNSHWKKTCPCLGLVSVLLSGLTNWTGPKVITCVNNSDWQKMCPCLERVSVPLSGLTNLTGVPGVNKGVRNSHWNKKDPCLESALVFKIKHFLVRA